MSFHGPADCLSSDMREEMEKALHSQLKGKVFLLICSLFHQTLKRLPLLRSWGWNSYFRRGWSELSGLSLCTRAHQEESTRTNGLKKDSASLWPSCKATLGNAIASAMIAGSGKVCLWTTAYGSSFREELSWKMPMYLKQCVADTQTKGNKSFTNFLQYFKALHFYSILTLFHNPLWNMQMSLIPVSVTNITTVLVALVDYGYLM